MNELITFCINSSEEDFFKYLMLSAAVFKSEQEMKEQKEECEKLLNRWNGRITQSNTDSIVSDTSRMA